MSTSKVTKAKVGDRVRVEYSGQFKDEKAGLQRLGREIFEFTIGSRDVMPGINKGIVGMVEGERKQMTLQPQDAYGEFRPNLIQEISRQRLPSDVVLKIGKRLTTVGQKSGQRAQGPNRRTHADDRRRGRQPSARRQDRRGRVSAACA